MSDAQLDTIIEKLDKIIEQIMLGGVTEGGGGGTFVDLTDTPVSDDDEVARWSLPGDHHLTLEVTKRHGVVIDVQILPS